MSTRNSSSMTSQKKDLRLIGEARADDIWERIRRFQDSDGDLVVHVGAWWRGELRWARNRVSLASDSRDISVFIRKSTAMGNAEVLLNQDDDASLEAALRAIERKIQYNFSGNVTVYDGITWIPPHLPYPETSIWSDATYRVTPAQRAELARVLSRDAEANGLLSAGFLQMRVAESCSYGTSDFNRPRIDVPPNDNLVGAGAERQARRRTYVRHTEAQCSMTVRHPKGLGSGWAGLSSYDWSAINAKHLAEQALVKCQNSLNPVAIEPGRYTVILEPPAVSELVDTLVMALQDRVVHEKFEGAFTLHTNERTAMKHTKLGLTIIDDRITIAHDPMDPHLGVLPNVGLGSVTWIDHGILKTLGYHRDVQIGSYSLSELNENLPMLPRGSYRMSGGETSIDDMIASTDRGIFVSRFYGVELLDKMTLLCSGVTRDGLWLIEKGKINKSVKNMRWTDSPLFFLNQVEQLGTPVPVFRPGHQSRTLMPTIVPPIKARDFAFTATIDAV